MNAELVVANEISAPAYRRISCFAPIWALALCSFLAGVVCAEQFALSWGMLLFGYVKPAVSLTALMVLTVVFVQTLRLLRSGHDNPRQELIRAWVNKSMLARLSLPALAAPLFLTGFTTIKSVSTISRAYDWDRLLTALDRFLFFGSDPWMLTHSVLNVSVLPSSMELVYIMWQFVLVAVLAGTALWMKPKNLATLYTTMFSTWLVGGVVVAVWMHSAGPIFAYLFDPGLGKHFAPLQQSLSDALGPHSRILFFDRMLPAYIGSKDIRFGGGISAMPSMHVATTAIYVFAAWKSRFWKWPAVTFSALIWVGSIYFGYHYATDGPVAYAIAGLCWIGSRALIDSLRGDTFAGSAFQRVRQPDDHSGNRGGH